MVDLKAQYNELKTEIDQNINEVIASCAFINGPMVRDFEAKLGNYLNVKSVIACGNGTDALQIALMALDLKAGDEVILPSFTYVATAEVIALLGLVPKMVDVDVDTFNVNVQKIKESIGPKTKAIVPVHLFGQCAPMEEIMEIAEDHNLFVIEDNAQSLGADYIFKDGSKKKSGTIGHIGCTSFYPSKNLGAYGDGGALMTNDPELGEKIRKIANHGQNKRYHHSHIGVNSRLDSLQAGILSAKLERFDDFNERRRALAQAFQSGLSNIEGLSLPKENDHSTHVYHQFTLKIHHGKRDLLQASLKSVGIPSMIYYPIPLYKQEAYAEYHTGENHPITENLCAEVISLPMHPNMNSEQTEYIIEKVKFFLT